MDENNEQLDDNIVVLNDEEGNEVQFEFLDLIDYEGEEYVILLPVAETEDAEADEVVILKTEKVADEDVLNAVFEIFKEKFKDEFNFVD